MRKENKAIITLRDVLPPKTDNSRFKDEIKKTLLRAETRLFETPIGQNAPPQTPSLDDILDKPATGDNLFEYLTLLQNSGRYSVTQIKSMLSIDSLDTQRKETSSIFYIKIIEKNERGYITSKKPIDCGIAIQKLLQKHANQNTTPANAPRTTQAKHYGPPPPTQTQQAMEQTHKPEAHSNPETSLATQFNQAHEECHQLLNGLTQISYLTSRSKYQIKLNLLFEFTRFLDLFARDVQKLAGLGQGNETNITLLAMLAPIKIFKSSLDDLYQQAHPSNTKKNDQQLNDLFINIKLDILNGSKKIIANTKEIKNESSKNKHLIQGRITQADLLTTCFDETTLNPEHIKYLWDENQTLFAFNCFMNNLSSEVVSELKSLQQTNSSDAPDSPQSFSPSSGSDSTNTGRDSSSPEQGNPSTSSEDEIDPHTSADTLQKILLIRSDAYLEEFIYGITQMASDLRRMAADTKAKHDLPQLKKTIKQFNQLIDILFKQEQHIHTQGALVNTQEEGSRPTLSPYLGHLNVREVTNSTSQQKEKSPGMFTRATKDPEQEQKQKKLLNISETIEQIKYFDESKHKSYASKHPLAVVFKKYIITRFLSVSGLDETLTSSPTHGDGLSSEDHTAGNNYSHLMAAQLMNEHIFDHSGFKIDTSETMDWYQTIADLALEAKELQHIAPTRDSKHPPLFKTVIKNQMKPIDGSGFTKIFIDGRGKYRKNALQRREHQMLAFGSHCTLKGYKPTAGAGIGKEGSSNDHPVADTKKQSTAQEETTSTNRFAHLTF